MDVMFRAVWKAMLTAEFSARYWDKMATRYDSRLKAVGILLAITSSGAFVSLISPLQGTIWPKIIAFLTAFAAIVSTQLKWQDLLSNICNMRGMSVEIAAGYQQIWRDLTSGSISKDAARERMDKIREKEIAGLKNTPNIREDSKLKDECYDEILTTRGLRKSTTKS